MAAESHLNYVLIPDSQALFVVKDRTDEVNPSFARLLNDCKQHCCLKLVIPETVRGEIVYQKVREVQTAAKRLRDGLTNLAVLTGRNYEKLPSDTDFRRMVEAKFDAWMKSVDAVVAPNEISAATWSRVIDDATWRLPPFEHSDDGRHEKGFRDALIKASILVFARRNKKAICAFVSDDTLLASAIENEKLENLRVFESMKLFAGHVSLVRESIDQKLAVALQANAQTMFFEDKNPRCIYFRENIDKRIRDRFGIQLSFPSLPSTGLGFSSLATQNPMTDVVWTQVGTDKIWLKGTTFSGRPEPSRFEWKSRLLYTGLFQPSNIYRMPQLRKILFEVTWTSRIIDSEIAEPQLVEPIALVESQFAMTNADEAKQYGLEMPSQPQMNWPNVINQFLENVQKISASQAKNPPTAK